jgi:hypothetical protein
MESNDEEDAMIFRKEDNLYTLVPKKKRVLITQKEMEKASLVRNIQKRLGRLARAVREGSISIHQADKILEPNAADKIKEKKIRTSTLTSAYLVSIGDPIDLTMVDPLKLKDGQGKNAERILEVIMTHVKDSISNPSTAMDKVFWNTVSCSQCLWFRTIESMLLSLGFVQNPQDI